MNDEEIKREKRRRRRIRNQILAYLTLAMLIVVALAVLCFGANGVVRYVKNYNNKVSEIIAEAESSMAAELENESARVPESTQVYDEKEYVLEPVEDPLGELVETLLQDMTLEEMVSGMFLVTPEALTGVQTVVRAGEGTQTALIEKPIGGLIYSAKNFKSKEQFAEMLQNTKGFSKYPLFLAVTVECGVNASFGIEDTKKAAEITKSDDAGEAYGVIAQALVSYGINMDMAPVSEIAADDDRNLAGRTFGSDAALAAPLVNAAIQALQEDGISAVLQKFPGTGTASKTLEELKNSEFMIYEAAIKNGVDCIMVSNVKSSGLEGEPTSDTPSSLSHTVVTDILRENLGFDGVVITDALDDASITRNYTPAEAAVAAIEAGADVLYKPADFDAAYEGVLKAIEDGTITKERIYESLSRIYRVKYKNAISY